MICAAPRDRGRGFPGARHGGLHAQHAADRVCQLVRFGGAFHQHRVRARGAFGETERIDVAEAESPASPEPLPQPGDEVRGGDAGELVFGHDDAELFRREKLQRFLRR